MITSGLSGQELITDLLTTLSDVGELSVFCQSYFNKMLIDQAGSIDGKARQEVGVEKRDREYSENQEALCIPAQTTEEAACEADSWKRYQAIWLTQSRIMGYRKM